MATLIYKVTGTEVEVPDDMVGQYLDTGQYELPVPKPTKRATKAAERDEAKQERATARTTKAAEREEAKATRTEARTTRKATRKRDEDEEEPHVDNTLPEPEPPRVDNTLPEPEPPRVDNTLPEPPTEEPPQATQLPA